MPASSPGSWSLRLGRWRGVELRVHLHLPLVALIALLATSLWASLPPSGDPVPPDLAGYLDPTSVRSALIAIFVLVASVMCHELVRAFIAERVGGRTNLIVLGPIGGWAQPHLPSDPPAHLITALSGPLTYLALLVGAGCCLAAAGEHEILQLLQPFQPVFIRTAS